MKGPLKRTKEKAIKFRRIKRATNSLELLSDAVTSGTGRYSMTFFPTYDYTKNSFLNQ